ncbi:hypothetical protein LOAG_12749 [Loa loa]|uniref:C2H2-type domain-containing protein n=1 Tax=Loa loa TaxID=7209 RepID=E1GHU8_LOALO|nr:hypothetical protein LOAG_12749 [Loa loa]EFO15759.1 hypothetical protein LOAG_12749 [Loa loa]
MSNRKIRYKHKYDNSCFSDVKKYKCPHIICNATIRGKTRYLEHVQKHNESSRYHCKQLGSGEEFHNHSSEFSSHKEVHQPKFKCEKCGFSSKYKNSLDRHKKQSCKASREFRKFSKIFIISMKLI